jgi:hypothetical protein
MDDDTEEYEDFTFEEPIAPFPADWIVGRRSTIAHMLFVAGSFIVFMALGDLTARAISKWLD